MAHFLRGIVRSHILDIVIAIALFFVALVPRVADLGTFLTADEKTWMFRAYEFIRAFRDFRFNDMLQTTHPGVTTMWLSGVSIVAWKAITGTPFTDATLIHFLNAAQLPIALVNALAVPAFYVLLRVLFQSIRQGNQVGKKSGHFIPVVAAAFIALDPALIGYSRVVHVDGLLASFLFLACLSIILFVVRGYQRTWLVVSAVLSAFAILTKAPGLFVIPFYILSVGVREGTNFFSWQIIKDRLRDGCLWLLLISIIIVLLWPAILWVPNPKGNVLLLKRDLSRAAATPHHMSQDYILDASYYPATLLTRVHPVIQILAIVYVASRGISYAVSRIRKKVSRSTIFEVLLVSYVILFVIAMTIGAKKGDRYILPVYPAVDTLASFGFCILIVLAVRTMRILTSKDRYVTFIKTAVSVGVVGIMGLTVIRYHPYAISYSNPMFPDNISQELGWGEGLEQVGRWLNTNAPRSTVASWYSEELAKFTSAEVLDLSAHDHPKVRYVVLYRNMFGRAPDHPATTVLNEYEGRRQPVFTATIVGKEFAWIYERRAYESIIGELTPGLVVRQDLGLSVHPVSGIEVRVATYSGRAKSGVLSVLLRETESQVLLYRWDTPVAELENDSWLLLSLPRKVSAASRITVEIYAQGTTAGDAPTVRVTRMYDYLPGNVTGPANVGDLAVRRIYDISGKRVSEEELLYI